MTGREPVTLDFTVRVTVDPAAYYAEYGELGRIEQVGPATYAREILTDLLFAGLLPAHQPPILRIEAPVPGVIPREVHAATILRCVRAAVADLDLEEEDPTPARVFFGATEYEDGWFVTEDRCRVQYRESALPIRAPLDLELEDTDVPHFLREPLHEALAGFAGRVGPDAVLRVDLVTGDVEMERQ